MTFSAVQKRWSTDSEALNLWNVQSGWTPAENHGYPEVLENIFPENYASHCFSFERIARNASSIYKATSCEKEDIISRPNIIWFYGNIRKTRNFIVPHFSWCCEMFERVLTSFLVCKHHLIERFKKLLEAFLCFESKEISLDFALAN